VAVRPNEDVLVECAVGIMYIIVTPFAKYVVIINIGIILEINVVEAKAHQTSHLHIPTMGLFLAY
jgi:hypothetical protein